MPFTLKNSFGFVENSNEIQFDSKIWKKYNIFSFSAHFISPRCTNTYSCSLRFFFFRLWCDYDDVDDIQRSATLAMRMRFYYYFYSLFLLNVSFFFFVRGIITQLQSLLLSSTARKNLSRFSCVTCINITPNEFSVHRDAARETKNMRDSRCFINKLHI